MDAATNPRPFLAQESMLPLYIREPPPNSRPKRKMDEYQIRVAGARPHLARGRGFSEQAVIRARRVLPGSLASPRPHPKLGHAGPRGAPAGGFRVAGGRALEEQGGDKSSKGAPGPGGGADPALACFVLLARFLGVPADPQQIAHDRGKGETPFSLEDLSRDRQAARPDRPDQAVRRSTSCARCRSPPSPSWSTAAAPSS